MTSQKQVINHLDGNSNHESEQNYFEFNTPKYSKNNITFQEGMDFMFGSKDDNQIIYQTEKNKIEEMFCRKN